MEGAVTGGTRCSSLTSCRCSLRRAQRADESGSDGRRPGGRQRDRTQRRGEVNRLQRDHRRLQTDVRRCPVAGESIAGQTPNRITRLGIARTFQSLRLFLNMSVKENVKAATYGGTKASPPESILRLPRARREEREVNELAEEVLSSSVSGCRVTAGTSPRTASPMPTGAGWRSPARSRRSRSCCCWTSRPPA